MVFNSIAFLVFFVLFFPLYWWIARKGSLNGRNILLIVSSYIFYGWWDWRFLGLIFISSLSDYLLGILIYQSQSKFIRKRLLLISILINLGILGFFKYFNFFTHSLGNFIEIFGLQWSTTTLKIILPVGISFYTFQTMSYTIDIYRGHLKPTYNPWQFFAFVSFFPQLVAGPIERASRFLPQFAVRHQFNYGKAVIGLRLMLWGFFKKIVIADNLAPLVEDIFGHPTEYSGFGIILGSVLFAFQIYCDFSGYSDIAIGLGKTLGFDLMTNFNKPYLSRSFGEFWKRWHISLSTWFRDYVYIPLGGNRVSPLRHDLNLIITFLLSGLWHGANFTFLIWGFLHGSMLILEKKWAQRKHLPVPVVFFICCLFWIPFRAKSITHLQILAGQLFTFGNGLLTLPGLTDPVRDGVIGLIVILFVLTEKWMRERNFSDFIHQFSKARRMAFYYSLLGAILLLGNFNVKPFFIYFQF